MNFLSDPDCICEGSWSGGYHGVVEVGFESTGESCNEVFVVGKCKVSTVGVEGSVVGVEVVVGHFDLEELGEELGVDVDW